jgi:serine/threonine protein kinase
MPDFDAQGLLDQAILIGLVSREQARQAREDADDGSAEAVSRAIVRKGWLTSWQLERLAKGDPTGFFYGGCKVLFHLAEGTFARVYRGVKEPGGQPVAIKVLRKRFTTDPDSVKRFNQEAEAGMKLNHPNIVRIYDYGEVDKNYFMTMEYVEGMNLRNFLRVRHRLKPHEALPMMIQLAEALDYSLSRGITHRDIKATNVLISNRGVAKLVDFGLATIEGDERKLQAAHGVRTVDYAALERMSGSAKGDPRSDIYFLGCVFYQMITGTPPMPEVDAADPLVKMLKRSFGAIKPISEHNNAPPLPMSQVIERMMKTDLKARYQSMAEVVADLKAYERSLQAPAPPPKPTESKPAKPAAPRPETLVEDDGEDFVAGLFESPVLGARRVLCVEIQEPIRDAFRKALSKMGYQIVLLREPERAVERYNEDPAGLVIFDLDGLPSDALASFLAMYESAQAQSRDLSALVLLSPKQAHLKPRLPDDDQVIVMVKPISMKDVQAALSQLAAAV